MTTKRNGKLLIVVPILAILVTATALGWKIIQDGDNTVRTELTKRCNDIDERIAGSEDFEKELIDRLGRLEERQIAMKDDLREIKGRLDDSDFIRQGRQDLRLLKEQGSLD